MKKLFGKAISVLLVAVMVLCAAPLAGLVGLDLPELSFIKAKAEETFTSGYYTYTVDEEGNATITSCDTSISGKVIIPSVLDEHPITVIGSSAFANCDSLIEIVIPASIKTIGNVAFRGCANLESFIIEDGSTAFFSNNTIGAQTPKLSKIKFPDGVRYGGTREDIMSGQLNLQATAFYKDQSNWDGNLLYIDNHLVAAKEYVSDSRLEIKDGVVCVAAFVFNSYKNLSCLFIPESVEFIGQNNFNNTTSLEIVCYESTEEKWNDINIKNNNDYIYSANKYYNHSHTDVSQTITVGRTPESCEISGYTGDVYCKDCNWLLEKGKYIDPLGHNYELTDISATCTGDGIRYKTCLNCNHTIIEEKYEATGHSFISKTVKSTCTDSGYTLNVCSNCGISTITDETNPIEHNYVLTVIEPTCTTDGYTLHSCTECNISFADNEIPASNHNYETLIVNPTCTTEGYTFCICSVCGMARKGESVFAIGHNYLKKVVEPTCTKDGYSIHICHQCGDVYIDSKASALGHDIIIDKAVASTCTETGLTEGQHCSRCDDMTVAQETVPVKPHNHIAKYDSAKHWEECACGSKINVKSHSFVGGNVCSCGFKRVVNSVIKIRNNNGSKTINYGEILKLTAVVIDKFENAKIYWYVDGVKKGEGEAFNVNFENGTKVVTAKLVDENGVVYENSVGNEISDSENVTVNGDFFQKLISFFKNLFGISRTVIQAFKGIY